MRGNTGRRAAAQRRTIAALSAITEAAATRRSIGRGRPRAACSPATPRSSRSPLASPGSPASCARSSRRASSARAAAASAFTIAFLVPNLLGNLFANAALSAAFVPVFSDLLQQGRSEEALRLASTLFWIMLIALGPITAFFILAAGLIMPLFTGSTFSGALDDASPSASRRCSSRWSCCSASTACSSGSCSPTTTSRSRRSRRRCGTSSSSSCSSLLGPHFTARRSTHTPSRSSWRPRAVADGVRRRWAGSTSGCSSISTGATRASSRSSR